MELRNKKIAVLGFMDPGTAVVRYAVKKGAKVTVFSVATETLLKRRQEELKGIAYQVVTEEIPQKVLLDFDLIILTPGGGRRYRHAVDLARQNKIPITTDLELACGHYQAPIIAITGTNGKSTVAHMIRTAFEAAGKKVLLAGGEFVDFADSMSEAGPFDAVILELSSTRLLRAQHFHPWIAVFLNLYPGHWERHKDLEEYRNAKAKIFAEQTKQDYLIYQDWGEVGSVVAEKKPRSKKIPFALKPSQGPGAFYQEETREVGFISEEGEKSLFSYAKHSYSGPHNLENILAALAVSKIVGLPDAAIEKMIRQTPPLPNRMEWVKKIDGVYYISDAKSTNASSTAAALQSFPDHSVVLIAGGEYEWVQFYDELIPLLQKKVRCLILFGSSRRDFYKRWGEAVETYVVPNIEQAVGLAHKKAEAKNYVLLSPACPPETHVHGNPHNLGNAFKQKIEELVEFEKAKRIIHRDRV